MPTLIQKLSNWYQYLFHDLADPRAQYPLLRNPLPVLLIIFFYLYFVLKLGPAIMKNRKPFKIKKIMIGYNIFQIAINTFLFVQAFRFAYGPYGTYSYKCQPVDRSHSLLGLYAVKMTYVYFLIKLLDLLDTIFMVIRAKNNHISFLHVYHHTGMVALVWGTATYFPGGHGIFLGFANTFVHMIMYGYYLLTLFWPPHQRNKLWWKKYLTVLQIIQFIVVGIHQTLPALQSSCEYTKLGILFVTPQAIFMTALFGDFYRKAYRKEKLLKDSQLNAEPVSVKNEDHSRNKTN